MIMTESIERPWRIVVLDDDVQTRGSISDSLDRHPAFDLAGSFGTLGAAMAWFASERHVADVLMTDLVLPDGDGTTLIAQVCRDRPECDCLVMSIFGDEDSVLRSIEAGAIGFLLKDARPFDVARTLLEVKAGASPISPMVARGLLRRCRRQQGSRTIDQELQAAGEAVQLSRRESQILDLIARGYSYAEVARLGGISISTVQSHIKHLYGKLAVHSRSEAVFEASRMGLLTSFRDAS